MKRNKALTILIVTIFLFSCSSDNADQTTKAIDFNTFKVIKKDFSNIREMGNIVKAVKLETTDSSAIGSIDKVIVDSKTGGLANWRFPATGKGFEIFTWRRIYTFLRAVRRGTCGT